MFKHLGNTIVRFPLQPVCNVPKLATATENRFLSEGIYLSSSDFWLELNKHTDSSSSNSSLNQTFLKYHLRSCTRCTPFATLAGCTVAKIGHKTNLVLDQDSFRPVTRLDMGFLCKLINTIERLPIIKKQIRYYPNNSIYETRQSYRYAFYENKNGYREYFLEAVEKNDLVYAILQKANDICFIDDLINVVINLTGETYENASAFLDEIIATQLIYSDLEPCISGGDPLEQLILKLRSLQNVDYLVQSLLKVQDLLRADIVKNDEYTRSLISLIEAGGIKVEKSKNYFQTDLFQNNGQLEIDENVISKILNETYELSALSVRNVNGDLEYFKNQFVSKYEDGSVSLTYALDADLGIGYGNNVDQNTADDGILENLPVANMNAGANIFSNLHELAVKKYCEYSTNHTKWIEITPDDILQYRAKSTSITLPGSMYIMGNLLVDKNTKSDFTFHIYGLSGPSGANLIGRFAYADENIKEATNRIIEDEENSSSDVIFAEIIHLPQARMGNIILRPHVRKYEIPYLGRSDVSVFQIPITDIMVKIVNDEIVVYSKKYGKRIIPRLTSAHNFRGRSLPIYKFLCDLQSQNKDTPIIWDWGPLNSIKYLPRVTYKNIIVKRARWILSFEDLENIWDDYSSIVTLLREKIKLAERVSIIEGDNELLVDLNIPDTIAIMLDYLKKYRTIVLTEFLFDSYSSCLQNVKGELFANEVIIPIKLENVTPYKKVQLFNSNGIKRKFYPFDGWLYFKIYTGTNVGEKLLISVINPFIKAKSNLFEKFFFLRYRDESPHLRIRFYSNTTENLSLLQREFLSYLYSKIDPDILHQITIDTYKRETERYTPELIENIETLFYFDSILTLDVVSSLPNGNSQLRFLIAAKSVDMIFNDFGLTLGEKLKYAKHLQANFFTEWGGSKQLLKELNKLFRMFSKDINKILQSDSALPNFDLMFNKRSTFSKGIITEMRTNHALILNDNMDKIVPSLAHMNLNRLFVAQPRKHELVVYHLLERYYSSLKARIGNFN